MSDGSSDSIALQTAELIRRLQTDDVLKHPDLRSALLDLIGRSGKGFHKAVATQLNKTNRVHKSRKDHSKTQQQEDFARFLKQSGHIGTEDDVRTIKNLESALRGLESSLTTPLDLYKTLLEESTERPSAETSIARASGYRQKMVMQKFLSCEQQTHVAEGLRRLWLLRIMYEVDQLIPEIERQQGDKGDVAAAEREFSRLSGYDENVIRVLRKYGRSYATMANRKNGLGIIFMLGPKTRSLWEHNLNDDSVSILGEFCEKNPTGPLAERALALQPIACQLILKSILEYGADVAELGLEGHVFSRHFKPTATYRRPVAGVPALVAATDPSRPNTVAVPPVVEDEQPQPQRCHNHHFQRSNGNVPTAVGGSADPMGCFPLPLNEQSVPTGEQHPGKRNNGSLQQREVPEYQVPQHQLPWNTAPQTTGLQWLEWQRLIGNMSEIEF